MSKRERILKDLIDDIIWMAIRYASKGDEAITVQHCLEILKGMYPNFELREDIVIKESRDHYFFHYFKDEVIKSRVMEYKSKTRQLKEIIIKLLPFALRYANGRHTYTPGIIRDTVRDMKKLYSNFELNSDKTIEPPSKKELEMPATFGGDYLYDLLPFEVVRGGDA